MKHMSKSVLTSGCINFEQNLTCRLQTIGKMMPNIVSKSKQSKMMFKASVNIGNETCQSNTDHYKRDCQEYNQNHGYYSSDVGVLSIPLPILMFGMIAISCVMATDILNVSLFKPN